MVVVSCRAEQRNRAGVGCLWAGKPPHTHCPIPYEQAAASLGLQKQVLFMYLRALHPASDSCVTLAIGISQGQFTEKHEGRLYCWVAAFLAGVRCEDEWKRSGF